MVQYPGDALKSGLKELLQTGIFSDLKIISKDGTCEWKVHKAILYTQSKYFEKALGGEFIEAKKDTIELPEDEDVLQALINYFYSFTWDDSKMGDLSTIEFAVLVYQAADKYDVPGLQQLATTRFASACKPDSDVESFVKGIYMLDECCNPKDRTLWNVVLPLIRRHMKHLLSFDSFKTLMVEKTDLTFLLLRQLGEVSLHTRVEDDNGQSVNISFAGGHRLGTGGSNGW